MAFSGSGFLPTYDGCFVCGQNRGGGLGIRFRTDGDGCVHADFRPDTGHTGYEDTVHGGVISALLDELIGWPVVLSSGRMCFTVELNVRFRRPVSLGGLYHAAARLAAAKGRIFESSGELRDSDGRICAEATGRYFLFSIDRTDAVLANMTYLPGDLRPRKVREGETGYAVCPEKKYSMEDRNERNG